MALAPILRTSGSNGAAPSVSTAPVAIATKSVLLVAVRSNASPSTAVPPTLTWNALSVPRISGVPAAGGATLRFDLYALKVAAGASSAVTIAMSPNASTRWWVIEVPLDAFTEPLIGQVIQQAVAFPSSLTIEPGFSPAPDSSSLLIAGFATGGAQAFTPRSSPAWTEVFDDGTALEAQSFLGNDSTASVSIGAGFDDIMGLAVEIVAHIVAPPPTSNVVPVAKGVDATTLGVAVRPMTTEAVLRSTVTAVDLRSTVTGVVISWPTSS